MRIRRFAPSPALVVASLALAIALAGTSYAAIVLPPGSVGTRQLRNGAVTGVKVKKGTLSAAAFARGRLPRGPKGDPGATGLPGPAGAQGPKGDQGDPATKLFAVVTGADGKATVKSDGVDSAKTGPNTYSVTFPQSVGGCAPVVTIGFDGASNGGQATASAPSSGANVIDVATFDETGSPDSEDFSIAVFC